ncbi:MAG: lipoprotein-releasing ABC transporter permease subunit [Proteobacteria bacterium]|nr:lipoprotein-releasing ABC transporter permease subunit [Pseudomonadota bacterium]
MPYEFFIALRYLKAKRKQSFISLITILSVAGVAVGVMALVVVIAVMSGAESDFRQRILGFQSHITVLQHGGHFSDYDFVSDLISSVPGVIETSPYISSQVLLRTAYGVSGASIRGINPDVSVKIIEGYDSAKLREKLKTPPASEDGKPVLPPIILGQDLAMNIGVSEGDVLYLISPKGMISPMGQVPSMRKYRVAGTFKSGMYEYDAFFAYMDIQDVQQALRMPDMVSGLDVWVKDMYQVAPIKKAILDKIGTAYWAQDWMQINASLFSALKLEKAAMFVILILIVLVAAFNIASTLIMLVMEKTKDIAILKTMGASDQSIRKIFVYQGTFIGMIGTGIGVSMGLALCYILMNWKIIELPSVYAFSSLPVLLEFQDVIIIAISALAICFLSTLYPAHQAAKIDPVEAIRYG